MKKEKKKAKLKFKNILPILIGAVIGAAIGFAIIFISELNARKEVAEESSSFGMEILSLLLVLLSLFIGYMVHIILHETGHLIAGLASGYKFSSFTVGSIMIIKQYGKLRLKKFSIVGAGGQCLLSPPEPIDNKYPFTMYYLGGGLMNLIASCLFFALFLSTRHTFLYAASIFIPIFGIGALLGVMNLLPLKISGLVTDGHNLVSLKKNEQARKHNWILLTENAWISLGGRAKDLPDSWFDFPDSYDFNDAISANVATMGLSRLIDKHDFGEAKILAEKILSKGDKLIDLLKNETRCELLFLEIIREPSQERKDAIEFLFTPELKKYIKASKTHLSKHRLIYAYEKLVLFDNEKAEKTLEIFNKVCFSYPYAGDRECEKELIGIIDGLAAERRKDNDLARS